MNTLCLMLGDNVRAKLYQTSIPPQELKLIYHQVNFGGAIADFAAGLCKRLGADLRAGRFDALVLMASRELLVALDQGMDETCRSHLLARMVVGEGQLKPSEQDLLLQLKDLLAIAPYERAGYSGESR